VRWIYLWDSRYQLGGPCNREKNWSDFYPAVHIVYLGFVVHSSSSFVQVSTSYFGIKSASHYILSMSDILIRLLSRYTKIKTDKSRFEEIHLWIKMCITSWYQSKAFRVWISVWNYTRSLHDLTLCCGCIQCCWKGYEWIKINKWRHQQLTCSPSRSAAVRVATPYCVLDQTRCPRARGLSQGRARELCPRLGTRSFAKRKYQRHFSNGNELNLS
jgi:hypothetical protein